MKSLRVFVVDDEPLAARRLARLLTETGRVEVVGTTSDPEEALVFLRENEVDALFLDIQMPGLTGFDVLARLDDHPPVVFTTAYDEYALRAFEVYAVDYLLKPIETEQLARALAKLERVRGGQETADLRSALDALARSIGRPAQPFPVRVASRVGDRVVFVDLDSVTHFRARDKLTYAVTETRDHVVDATIADLEKRLDPSRFLRIHRSAIVNARYVREVVVRFGGKLVVRLSDVKGTEVEVARDRAKEVRERLGF